MVRPNVEDVIKAIAADTNTPVEIVSKMYVATWDEFSDGARIMDYMAVLVAKHVRENLRRVRQDRREVVSATSLGKSHHNVELWQAPSESVDACAVACVPAVGTASLVR